MDTSFASVRAIMSRNFLLEKQTALDAFQIAVFATCKSKFKLLQ